MLGETEDAVVEGLPPWFAGRLSVRVSQERVAEVLGDLDAARRPVAKERRFYRRYRWRGPRAIVEFPLNPDSDSEESETVLAITRNLSIGGLAFLNGFVIPVRTQIMVMPPATTGLRWPLKATVVRCRNVDVMVYEVGLRFQGRRKGDLLMGDR